jgi:hypothetical protein
MRRIQTPEITSRHEQLVLFRCPNASWNEIEGMNALRTENLKLVETAGWKKSGEIVCMADPCYVPLEIWTRRKKGKPLQRKFVDRDTLILHEHTNMRRSEGL